MDRRAIEFNNNLYEYKISLQTLINVLDINKGQEVGKFEIWGDFESLTSKIVLQAVSALKLYDNNFIHYNNKMIFACDFSSINVITRSILETYLHAWWLFIDVAGDDEREYKVLCWRIAAMSLRLSFVAITQDGKDVLENEKQNRKYSLMNLHSNHFFNSFAKEEKEKIENKILNGKNIRPGWKEILDLAKFSKDLKYLYSYLCDYSHSGQLSSLQIYTAHGDIAQQKELCRVAMNTIIMCICRMVRDYSDVWTLSKEYLQSHDDESLVIEKWCTIAESPWR